MLLVFDEEALRSIKEARHAYTHYVREIAVPKGKELRCSAIEPGLFKSSTLKQQNTQPDRPR